MWKPAIAFRRSRCRCRNGDGCLRSILEREKPWIWSRDVGVLQKKPEKMLKTDTWATFLATCLAILQ